MKPNELAEWFAFFELKDLEAESGVSLEMYEPGGPEVMVMGQQEETF